jgi:hypothetical protein
MTSKPIADRRYLRRSSATVGNVSPNPKLVRPFPPGGQLRTQIGGTQAGVGLDTRSVITLLDPPG